MANTSNNNLLFYCGIIMPTAFMVVLFVIFLVAWFKCKLRDRMLHHKCRHGDHESRLVLCGPNSNLAFDHIDSDKTPDLDDDGYVALFIPSTSDSNKDIKPEYTGSWLIMKKYDNYGYIQPRMYLQKEHIRTLSAQLLHSATPHTDVQVQVQNVNNLRLSVGSTNSDNSNNRLGFRNINNNTELRPSLGLTRSARAKANRYITDRSAMDRTINLDGNHGNHEYCSVHASKAPVSPHRYINGGSLLLDMHCHPGRSHDQTTCYPGRSHDQPAMSRDYGPSHDNYMLYYSTGLSKEESSVV